MTFISGLPLDEALARLREAGFEGVRVEMTQGPRARGDGEARALRFQDGVLLAALFPPAADASKAKGDAV